MELKNPGCMEDGTQSEFGDGYEEVFDNADNLGHKLLSIGNKLECKKTLAEACKDMRKLREQVQRAQEKLEQQQDQNEEESWQELFHILEDLQQVWEVTPTRFVMNITVLGYQAKEYLDLLSICLDSSKFWKQLHYDQRCMVGDGMEAVVLTRALSDFEESNPFIHESWSGWFNCHSYTDNITSASREYTTHWTTMQALIAPNDVGDMIYIAKALHNCGNYSDCYNSVSSRSILDRYWTHVFNAYMVQVALDFGLLFSLGCNIAWIMYSSAHKPLYWMTKVSGLLAVRAAISPFVSVFTTCIHYGCKMGLMEYATFWLLAMALAETTVGYEIARPLLTMDVNVTCNAAIPDQDKCRHPCFFISHPVAVMAAIGLSWIRLTMDLMCLKFFGRSVLPAFYAITGPEAVKFGAFICLVLGGSFQAYWSLPIPANQPRPGYSAISNTFEKIFQLDVLGGYDEADLEGLSHMILRHNHSWEIVGGDESMTYHDGIRMLSVFLAMFVAVGVMNMSIGVLSHAYDENKAKANQIYYHFLSAHVFKLLLREKIIFVCCPRRHTSPEHNEDSYNQLKGYVVRFHEDTFWDQEDLSLHVQQLAGKLDRLQKNMEERERKIENLLLNGRGPKKGEDDRFSP